MSSNILLLDIPNFEPKYKSDTLYGYTGKGGENLKKLLTETSKGYCMYCYSRILVDRKNFGSLEHSIEKINCNKLVNCSVNISIACSKCNLSFKKQGEKHRKLSEEEIKEFERLAECSADCINKCSKYDDLRKSYAKKLGGEIILQPFGVKGKDGKKDLSIQYDVLNQKFIPSTIYQYDKEERQFIERHINRFNLNDSKYRTKEFVAFIEDVIEYKFIPKKNRYCNLVVELFIEKLEKMPFEKALKLCEIVYGQLVINGKI